MKNYLNIFSVYSGILYKVQEEEFLLLDDGQVPLLKEPSSCKKCYNRRYTGFNVEKNTYIPCKCIHKIADYSRVHAKFNVDSSSV